ncbi:hypothetical protein ILYODFUR_020844 [Ilyodon furcidens]|uniref:CCHC-type domain-containing protein n=1 Tax=Ilyodon furcidens TaxID=33524 RepID=A0ABV0UU62_9TELE
MSGNWDSLGFLYYEDVFRGPPRRLWEENQLSFHQFYISKRSSPTEVVTKQNAQQMSESGSFPKAMLQMYWKGAHTRYFKDAECRACQKKGHIAKACRSCPEGRKDKHTKWTKHLEATMEADAFQEKKLIVHKGKKQPAVCRS